MRSLHVHSHLNFCKSSQNASHAGEGGSISGRDKPKLLKKQIVTAVGDS